MPDRDLIAVEITIKDIYEMVCKLDQAIRGNGKKGLAEQISNAVIRGKINSAMLFLIVGTLIGGALGGLF